MIDNKFSTADLSQPFPTVSEEEKQSARLLVAGFSHDNEDCALLLDALGLLKEGA